jgi:fatty-acyl-CoA synthase
LTHNECGTTDEDDEVDAMNMESVKFAVEARKPRPASAAWGDALAATAAIERNPTLLLPHIVEQLTHDRGGRPALLSDVETLTFGSLARRMKRYGDWAHSQGLKAGDCVALMLSNQPDYVAIWLGLSKRGIVVALINTALTGNSLRHCLDLAAPRHIIAEGKFISACAEYLGERPGARIWDHASLLGGTPSWKPIPANEEPVIDIDDTALLIYTSGTTGLPKAARVSHRRLLNWSLWFKGLLGNTSDDRMYNCLPLYHSVGGVVAVMATLVAGGSTVIAGKFSARRFWDDIRRWECTQFQYIGELCRYLLNAQGAGAEKCGRLRLACGNGLRGDIWTSFQDRFSIPWIVEFYAATEGSFSLFNVEQKPGSIGRIPPYLRHRFPTAIVRFDVETGQPLRTTDGHCVPVETGEVGEALGRIGHGDGAGRFEGYTDPAESERKVLRNVFKPGDAWFRTGDLMSYDARGFFYFADRIGETFRWKGENVSTLEVADVLRGATGINDAVVYGVDVPGMDGKAGMALLLTGGEFNFETFRRHAEAQLPHFAIPVFLRMAGDVAVTETFKHKRKDLMADGFNPANCGGGLFVWQGAGSGYQRLDQPLYDRIVAGQVRL